MNQTQSHTSQSHTSQSPVCSPVLLNTERGLIILDPQDVQYLLQTKTQVQTTPTQDNPAGIVYCNAFVAPYINVLVNIQQATTQQHTPPIHQQAAVEPHTEQNGTQPIPTHTTEPKPSENASTAKKPNTPKDTTQSTQSTQSTPKKAKRGRPIEKIPAYSSPKYYDADLTINGKQYHFDYDGRPMVMMYEHNMFERNEEHPIYIDYVYNDIEHRFVPAHEFTPEIIAKKLKHIEESEARVQKLLRDNPDNAFSIRPSSDEDAVMRMMNREPAIDDDLSQYPTSMDIFSIGQEYMDKANSKYQTMRQILDTGMPMSDEDGDERYLLTDGEGGYVIVYYNKNNND